ncbi:hypothetical protein PTSG_07807 [Salpingoeca rosetta]|uniref:MITD1 C-terminal phospholipase D-like domain-containing protein n=1 Tax=Salpingoeca rosetta (strain ATCC 50818 / BSB-021) TaxID=946362 RepID=F2UGD9_SALR5|nr:uncharacterized protein PTSG_07807 [Salpingoeca rosetta]EGD75689.1 hypothetical protein PTSG_07807 [Salpingoeca rosetta]|eukprot:XP_004991610.1 hypothetical protein PTSG_07807 [Salpingoeca rosetta]
MTHHQPSNQQPQTMSSQPPTIQTAQVMALEAKDLRAKGRVQEAAAKLECTIKVLLDAAKAMTSEESRQRLLVSVKRYLDALEDLKQLAKLASKRLEIAQGTTGHSYESIFGPVMQRATEVTLDEPYLCKPYQLHNLTRFCELCARNEVKVIRVHTTNPRGDDISLRDASVHTLKASLREHGMTLHVNIRGDLHDRQAKFNNGFVVRLGRGLHIYQRSPHYTLGSFDDKFRTCLATNITYDFDASLQPS